MVNDPGISIGSALCERDVLTGGRIPGLDEPAFTLHIAHNPAVPVLVAVPHAGRMYPKSLTQRMRNPHAAALRLEDRYVDLVGESASAATDTSLLVAHAPRAMLDLNRSREDIDWGMVEGGNRENRRNSLANRRSRNGLGLFPRRLPGDGEIWSGPLSRSEVDNRIENIHRPYHQALAQELARIRDYWGAALLVDLHSMPPLKQKYDQPHAPDIVIGDRFGASCEQSITANALHYLQANRRVAARNRPYSGGYVLDAHAAPRYGIHALQLEISRGAYLDSALQEPGREMAAIGRLVGGLIAVLGQQVARIGERNMPSQAAE